MADVITRFKLETTQYDSKIRDSVKSLKEVVQTAELAGKDFKGFQKSTLDAARALGTMELGAKNSKDKVKELVGAFNDMAKTYNTMSQSIRESDVGKALAESMKQLQGRIKEAKQELYDLGDVAKNSGGLFGGDKESGMLQVFGGNLMTKAAEWAASLGSEVMEAVNQSAMLAREAEGITVAFQRLGHGDLLDGLREATHNTVSDLELMKAAVKFNDFKLPLDELGTMLAFAQQKAKDTGQSVDYMVDSIVTGLGRKSLMILDNLGLSAAEVKERMAETGDMTKAVGDIIREQMAKAGDYVETASDRATQANVKLNNAMLELGNSMRELTGFSGWDEMATAIKTEVVGAIQFTIDTIFEARDAWNSFMQAIGLQDKPQKQLSGSQRMPDGTYWETTDAQGNVTASGRWLNGKQVQTGLGEVVVTPISRTTRTPKGRGGSTAIDVSGKVQSSWDKAMVKSGLGADKMKPEDIISPPSVWEQFGGDIAKDMKGALSVFTEGMMETNDSLNNLSIDGFMDSYDAVKQRIEELNIKLKQQKAAYSLAGQAAQNFGAALQGIDDPAAKVAGTVMQAVASIALGFAMASSNANTAGTGWGWLAWLAAGTAAMATTIATVHSLTGYAEGGMIKGNSYSGDNIGGLVDGSQFVGLNAGEIVLNQAGQRNVAAGLQRNGMGGMRLQTKVRGTELLVWIDNALAQAGKGEMVTWGT